MPGVSTLDKSFPLVGSPEKFQAKTTPWCSCMHSTTEPAAPKRPRAPQSGHSEEPWEMRTTTTRGISPTRAHHGLRSLASSGAPRRLSSRVSLDGRGRSGPQKKEPSAAFFPCDVVLVPVPTLNMEVIQERSGRMRNGGRDGRDDCSAPGAKPLDRRMSWRGAGRDAAGYNGV